MADSILVLDDEQTYAEMLRDLLGDHGFQAEIATDPREALERLHEQSFALIVSDFKMPEVDGAQFLIEARRIVPRLPVIMVSGLMTTPDLLKVANIGVTLVLEKPFNVDVFLEHVTRFVTPDRVAEEDAEEAGAPEARDGEDYPRPLRYLVDDSRASQEFLADLWDAHRREVRHLLLRLPPGSEFSEIVKEVGAWRGAAGLATFHFSLLELASDEVRRTIRELANREQVSPVIAITLPDGAHLSADLLCDFIDWTANEQAVRERLVFLHGLPLELELDSLLTALSPAQRSMVGGPLVIQPLRERLVDLAAYMARFLDAMPRDARRTLAPEAANLLLRHAWEGNHREFISVLRRAFHLCTGGTVQVAHVEQAIRSRHGTPEDGGPKLDLESFLLLEQRRYLMAHSEPDADLKTLAEVTGIGLDRLQAGRSPADQPLLFPELLQEDADSILNDDDDGSHH